MAYPTGTLGIVLSNIDQRIANLKQFCIQARDRSQAGPITSGTIIDTFINLQGDRNALIQARSVQGLAEYAQAEKGDNTLDIVVEFNEVIATIETTAAWIQANFPKDGSGFLLSQTLEVTGPVDRTFTTVQTEGFRSALQAIIDRIN